MEEAIINAAGTLAFGGGGIAIVSYFAYLQFKTQSEHHKASIERICDTFDREMERREKSLERILGSSVLRSDT
jgi:biopolymer transport protein ExbB/TolQ